MAKKQNDEPQNDEPRNDEPGPSVQKVLKPTEYDAPTPTPTEVPTTRVLLTGDNRTVLTERYVPTTDNMFRIYVDGQHYEHVEVGEGGVWIYAPTR